MVLAAGELVALVDFAPPPQVGMEHTGRGPSSASTGSLSSHFHRQQNRHALLDVEHVLVFAAVRRFLLLLGIAVQVEDVNLVECLHEVLRACRGG